MSHFLRHEQELGFDFREGIEAKIGKEIVEIFVDVFEFSLEVKHGSLGFLVLDFEFSEGLHEFKRLGLVIDDGIVPI